MFDEAKIGAVRASLAHACPACKVYDLFDVRAAAQIFRIDDSDGRILHLVIVSKEFFHNHSAADIPAFLQEHDLVNALRQAGPSSRLLVGNDGLHLQHR